MQRSGSILAILVLLTAVHFTAAAQKLWTNVTMDRSSAYIGQPVQVTIGAYTSTWFTRGIDLGNIKVNGAFTVYFRPVSVSIVEGGQTYAGVELKYLVFPYRDEDVIFPSLEIKVETPPEGGYKGVERTLRTEEKRIRIKPIPPGFDEDTWLVSTNLTVRENWNGDRSNVKVGDVITRTVSRSASGTVSELIPPVKWDSIPGVSLYPARSTVDNQRSRTAISASRVESVRYLFEKEGAVTFPEMVLTWYNPNQSKLYKRTLPEVTIDVKPNPDLGLLESIRDSLVQGQMQEQGQEQEANAILGMSPRKFAAVIGLVVLGLVLIFSFGRLLIRKYREARGAYLGSEKYYFDQFMKALKQGSSDATAKLYRWIDELNLDEPSIYGLAHALQDQALAAYVMKVASGSGHGTAVKSDVSTWRKVRRAALSGPQHQKPDVRPSWINP